MPSYSKLADLISRISYKPGWKFELRRETFLYSVTSSMLIITATVKDSRNPENTVEFVMQRMVPEYLTDQELFLKWVKHTLMECEIHEMREFFRLDGELVDDPHAVKAVL